MEKNKINWRPIEEYFQSNGKYDWVLVRMYDGPYACLPCVAEYRENTASWHMNSPSDDVLPFEVKEFVVLEEIINMAYDMSDDELKRHQMETAASTPNGADTSEISSCYGHMMNKFNRLN